MLTGKEIAESGMVIGFSPEAVQQQGIDLRVTKVKKIKKGSVGAIPLEGKTIIPEYNIIEPLHLKNDGTRIYGWMLPIGVYDIEFAEGLDVKGAYCMKPLTRSSLVRCGAQIDSGLFDAGFKTDRAGAMLYVSNPIVIAVGARVAQIVCYESGEVENLYNGQFQGDAQRNINKY